MYLGYWLVSLLHSTAALQTRDHGGGKANVFEADHE